MKHSLGRFGLGNASLGFGLFISQFLLNRRAKVLIFILFFVSLHPTLQIIKMEYRKIGDNYYIRMDRDDEIISNLVSICEKESIPSAVFSVGHLKATTILYTAEIELRPTVGGAIGRKFDPETGTGFWDFK